MYGPAAAAGHQAAGRLKNSRRTVTLSMKDMVSDPQTTTSSERYLVSCLASEDVVRCINPQHPAPPGDRSRLLAAPGPQSVPDLLMHRSLNGRT